MGGYFYILTTNQAYMRPFTYVVMRLPCIVNRKNTHE